MRAAAWESSAGALAAFLNSTTQCHMDDLYTLTSQSGAVLARWTSADAPVTVNGNTYAIGPAIKRGKTKIAVGVAVDTLDVTLAADSTVQINSVGLLPFIAAGGLDNARVTLDRAFAAGPPSYDVKRNLLTYTEDFRNTAEVGSTRPWGQYDDTGDNVGVVSSTGAGPFGPGNLSKFIMRQVSPARHQLYQAVAVPDNTVLCMSVFAKAAECNYLQVVASTKASTYPIGIFNLTTGALTMHGAGALTYGSIQYPGGWWRLWVTFDSLSGAGTVGINFVMSNAGGGDYAGSIGDGVYVDAAQFEYASLTDYQPVLGGAWAAANPWIGTLNLFAGRVSDTNVSRYEATLNVASDSELLDVMVPRNVYAPGCGNTLFDGTCGLAKASFSATATATTTTDTARTTFTASALAGATDKYALGWAVGVTGPNAGVGRTIKAFTSGGIIQTIQPWPAAVAIGNTFTVYPGCDKTIATCTSKFSNAIRFRGQPFVPPPETVM